MNSPVAKIKESLGIEEVVSSYLKLEPAGSNLKARCPFHNEKTPSFFVSPGRGSYYCFGCGASGDIFTFVEEFEGLDFKGALKLLADKAGVPLTSYSREATENRSEKERLYEAMEESAKFFESNLKENKDVLAYLKDRGLTDKTIADFKIGYISPDWRQLYTHLLKKGFTDTEMEKAGLTKKTEKGYYDRFRGRIMFPIADTSGRIIAFTGRQFIDDEKSAKYLNSPDTPIFSKSSVLYGLDKAKNAIKKNDFSIVVEGQFDLILSHQAGYKNTVATSGTSLAQAGSFILISRLSNNIIFVFDYDKAGFEASVRAAKIALDLDMNVKAVDMPAGMDPAELILKQGPDTWKEKIKNANYLIEFLFEKYIPKSKKADLLTTKLAISKNIIPVINHIKNPITRSHFLSSISHTSGIKVEDIADIANSQLPSSQEYTESIADNEKVFRKDYILRKLMGIILWQQTQTEQKLDTNAVLKEISGILNTSQGEILEKAKENKEDLIFEAEVFYEGDMHLERDATELLGNLKEEYLQEELFKKMKELHAAEEKKDPEKGRRVLQEINDINNTIQNIKTNRLQNKTI